MEFQVAPIPASFGASGAEASRPCSSSRASQWGCELPRSLHPQALPATEFRVASSPASFGASGGEAQVAPHFTLSVAPAEASPRVAPGFCVFRPCRRWIFELPRISHPSAPPALSPGVSPAASHFRLCLPMLSTGCPGSCIFRLCRRPFHESPRGSYPSALLALMLRVAPQPRVSSCASQWGCGSLRPFHLPALPRVRSFGFPLCLVPLAPADGSPSCLGSRTLRLCRPCVFRFPWILHLRLGQWWLPGSPRTLHPRLGRGWIFVTNRIGTDSALTLDAFFNFTQATHTGKPT